jgi:hypothetical protein
MAFVPFVAGQRVTAAALNGNSVQLLSATTLAAATASVNVAVPVGYNRLQVYFTGKSNGATNAVSARITLNNDTGANYNYIYTQSNNGTTSTADNTGQTAILVGTMTAATSTANYAGSGSFTIDNTGNGIFFPTIVGTATTFVTTTNMYNGVYTSQWLSLADVTSIQFSLSVGSWVTGSQFSLYGVG